MNVLMISDVYFPRINGVSTSIETFRTDLHAQGVSTTLIAPHYPRQDASRIDDAALVRIASRHVPFDPEDRMMKRSAIRAWLRSNRERFDLVHIQTPFVAHYAGLEIARALGLPAIASYHTYFEEYLHHYIPLLPRVALQAMARRFSRSQCDALDALIVPSRAMVEALQHYGIRTPMHILPTGLPPDRYVEGDGRFFRERYGIPASRPLLLFVGRVAYEKNIGFLLNMMARLQRSLPDVLLLVTGEGPALEALRDQAAEAGLSEHVRFLGYLDRRHELIDCYAAADLFVFASRTETQGLVLLEAMAAGTPVLALSVMGTRDILEPAGDAALIGIDDPAAFAEQAKNLLLDGERLQRMGNAARHYARCWDAESMTRRVMQLYQTTCEGKQADECSTSAQPSRLAA